MRTATPEPVSSAGKSKREDGAKEDKRKKDSSSQPAKSTRAPAGGKASQASTTPQQAAPGQAAQGSFVAHKEIKLTLLNKVRLLSPRWGHQFLRSCLRAQGRRRCEVPGPGHWQEGGPVGTAGLGEPRAGASAGGGPWASRAPSCQSCFRRPTKGAGSAMSRQTRSGRVLRPSGQTCPQSEVSPRCCGVGSPQGLTVPPRVAHTDPGSCASPWV